MYKLNDTQSFDDHLDELSESDELGFSFGGVLKAASPLLKVGSAIGVPGAGAASAAVDIAGKLGKKKKKKPSPTTAVSRPSPTTAVSRPSPTTAVSRPSTSTATTQDPILHARIAHIAATIDRAELKNKALKIIRAKGIEAKYKKELLQKLNTILSQLQQLDVYIHSQLGGQTTVPPRVVDILGGKDFISRIGR
jgi:hypothetical protein